MNEDALKAAREHDPKRPGKFEGEPPETVYFYNASLDDGADDEFDFGGEGTVDLYEAFKVAADEAKEFGLKKPWFVIRHHDNGFVSGNEASDAAIRDLNRQEAEFHAEQYEP